ncbi:hypothetical protein C8R44DRAFT_747790 [Mycena epipterygia]|nr:hypothetical protein C8R44DRAFT_747790 [Mycena epipterygia]
MTEKPCGGYRDGRTMEWRMWKNRLKKYLRRRMSAGGKRRARVEEWDWETSVPRPASGRRSSECRCRSPWRLHDLDLDLVHFAGELQDFIPRLGGRALPNGTRKRADDAAWRERGGGSGMEEDGGTRGTIRDMRTRRGGGREGRQRLEAEANAVESRRVKTWRRDAEPMRKEYVVDGAWRRKGGRREGGIREAEAIRVRNAEEEADTARRTWKRRGRGERRRDRTGRKNTTRCCNVRGDAEPMREASVVDGVWRRKDGEDNGAMLCDMIRADTAPRCAEESDVDGCRASCNSAGRAERAGTGTGWGGAWRSMRHPTWRSREDEAAGATGKREMTRSEEGSEDEGRDTTAAKERRCATEQTSVGCVVDGAKMAPLATPLALAAPVSALSAFSHIVPKFTIDITSTVVRSTGKGLRARTEVSTLGKGGERTKAGRSLLPAAVAVAVFVAARRPQQRHPLPRKTTQRLRRQRPPGLGLDVDHDVGSEHRPLVDGVVVGGAGIAWVICAGREGPLIEVRKRGLGEEE